MYTRQDNFQIRIFPRIQNRVKDMDQGSILGLFRKKVKAEKRVILSFHHAQNIVVGETL